MPADGVSALGMAIGPVGEPALVRPLFEETGLDCVAPGCCVSADGPPGCGEVALPSAPVPTSAPVVVPTPEPFAAVPVSAPFATDALSEVFESLVAELD